MLPPSRHPTSDHRWSDVGFWSRRRRPKSNQNPTSTDVGYPTSIDVGYPTSIDVGLILVMTKIQPKSNVYRRRVPDVGFWLDFGQNPTKIQPESNQNPTKIQRVFCHLAANREIIKVVNRKNSSFERVLSEIAVWKEYLNNLTLIKLCLYYVSIYLCDNMCYPQNWSWYRSSEINKCHHLSRLFW